MTAARSSFSLKTLFLLMTYIAVLAAMVGHAWRHPIIVETKWVGSPANGSPPASSLLVLLGGLFIAGSLLGACLGLRFHRRLQGALIGLFTGWLTAGLAAALVMGDPSMSVALGGCSAVLIASVVLRQA